MEKLKEIALAGFLEGEGLQHTGKTYEVLTKAEAQSLAEDLMRGYYEDARKELDLSQNDVNSLIAGGMSAGAMEWLEKYYGEVWIENINYDYIRITGREELITEHTYLTNIEGELYALEHQETFVIIEKP